MRSWSVPVGRIFGVEVRLHLTFVFLLIFVWMTESATPHGPGVARAFALVGIIFGSVVAHELGHALAALHSGIPARSIILLPIGGVTLMDESMHREPDPRRDIRIALAGPWVNLAIGLAAGAALESFAPQANLWGRPYVFSGNLLRSVVWANLFLGAFNLLPAYPLDGGRVLRSLFMRNNDPVRATRRAVTVGQAFAMLFIFIGIWNTWLMLMGFFLFVAAQLEERSAGFQSVLE